MRSLCAIPVLLAAALLPSAPAEQAAHAADAVSVPLIVIGFMGGNVQAGNLVHREALMARELQRLYPLRLHATVFANRDGQDALHTVLDSLDPSGRGQPTAAEKARRES